MRVFLDCEFTGLHKDTTLISIGLIADDGNAFYAEFTDYAEDQVDEWIEKNVIESLFLHKKDLLENIDSLNFPEDILANNVSFCMGSKEHVRDALAEWFDVLGDNIEIWSDCLAYDWVLFNDLFGTAFDIPKQIFYIPFDICTLFKFKLIDPDVNREEFAEVENKNLKHNALWDAFVIKKCYDKLCRTFTA